MHISTDKKQWCEILVVCPSTETMIPFNQLGLMVPILGQARVAIKWKQILTMGGNSPTPKKRTP
jgi:hypothetical protein